MNTTEEKDGLNLITLAQQYSDDDKASNLHAAAKVEKIKRINDYSY
jgi:hypothetical protein